VLDRAERALRSLSDSVTRLPDTEDGRPHLQAVVGSGCLGMNMAVVIVVAGPDGTLALGGGCARPVGGTSGAVLGRSGTTCPSASHSGQIRHEQRQRRANVCEHKRAGEAAQNQADEKPVRWWTPLPRHQRL
jgi:hypothetical protein